MPVDPSAPWHKQSYDRLLQDHLPELLANRLPLSGYRVEPGGPHACRVHVTLSGSTGNVDLVHEDLPQPDEAGIFEIDGRHWVVPPVADGDGLETANVRCVGEQAYDFIQERLGEAPPDLAWDEALGRAWLPLTAWLRAFVAEAGSEVELDHPVIRANWLARQHFVRRLHVPNRQRVFAEGHIGRVCPIETPEGPNVGRVLTISLGAEIRAGRLIVADDRPESGLGLTASMIPFLEHSDPNRTLMGANMMRQCMIPPDPEPALVQTGNEPDDPEFWCGRNLLTAFITWDGYGFEDAIVISQSCAARLDFPYPVERGDKMSNRHGAKGVVSQMLPDDAMPCLPDGTPVELIYSLCNLPSRMNFGQVREAVMGRIAHSEGKPAQVPPFGAPADSEIRSRLAGAGLPEDGMEQLSLGGEEMAHRSTVGWVYWGCLSHIARDKIHASTGASGCQRQGHSEYHALCESGAYEIIREQYNTCAVGREDDAALADRVVQGSVEQAAPPSPQFASLSRRLAAAGIEAKLAGEALAFGSNETREGDLVFARPIPHPWLPGRELEAVGAAEVDLPEYRELAEANERLSRMLESGAPDALTEQAYDQLIRQAGDYLNALLGNDHLTFGSRASFSGRTVIVPDPGLMSDQIGLPDEIAWEIFGPLVHRELGSQGGGLERDTRTREALDRVMARSWVIAYRAPALKPTAFLAFRPVRRPDRSIGLCPLACWMMNADFDGDQMAVYLPVTAAGQQEAGERLTIAAHLERDPGLIAYIAPWKDAMVGLAVLGTSEKGTDEIRELAGVEVRTQGGIVTREAIVGAIGAVLRSEGPAAALEVAEGLTRKGFEVARGVGGSVGPFVGTGMELPAAPEDQDPDQWRAYHEEVVGWLASHHDFADSPSGPFRLTVACGAWGNNGQLAGHIGVCWVAVDVKGEAVPICRGLREGLTHRELMAIVPGARSALERVLAQITDVDRDTRERSAPVGHGVLARASRSNVPGVVFARAAAARETDPLADGYTRLFIGLSAEGAGRP